MTSGLSSLLLMPEEANFLVEIAMEAVAILFVFLPLPVITLFVTFAAFSSNLFFFRRILLLLCKLVLSSSFLLFLFDTKSDRNMSQLVI